MRSILLPILLLFTSAGFAQVTLLNGKHVLELSGEVSTYFNYRSLKDGEFDHSKDRFKLRDAQIEIEGRVGADFEYNFKVDFADMAANSSTEEIDPENPGLMEASVTYKGFHFMDVEMGYGKLYYSRSALVPFDYSAYWQRAELTRGSIFATRDVGITLMKNFWKQRANVYLGAYTGLGEASISGDNDASGNLEFVGRFDVSYPARYRFREIDDRHTPIPMFSVGVNGRFANKQLPEGEVFPTNAAGEYGLKVIDGKRYVYGMDASFQYMGFSGQFEIHQIKAQPQSATDPLFLNTTAAQNHGYILAGGYIAQANYFIKNWKTIISARYEELDLNDLAKGKSQRFSPAIAYQIHGYNAMVKFQYFNIIKEESIDPLKWDEQFRIGMQFQFK
ncbi:MAG TPA: porin [Flavobacterium sp.]|nr:porin [Flavobacterium sp.]